MSSPLNQANDWNRRIIEEFRANGGRVGGNFAGAPLLLLHTVGARSGKERINPMMYQNLGEGRVAVFASKAGEPTHPDWYHNLLTTPDVTAEIGTETRRSAPTAPAPMNASPSGPSRSRSTPVSPATKPRPTGRSPSSSWSRPDRR